jgi:hypothetical protein
MEGVSPDDARPALGDCGRWLASLRRAVFARRGNAAQLFRACGRFTRVIGGSALAAPIAMSTLAMILALLPLGAAVSGSGDQTLQPLAIAIIAGIAVQLPLVLIACRR